MYEWTLVKSDVVYKQLYYVVGTLLLHMTKEFRFGIVSMDFAMDQVLCDWTEERLSLAENYGREEGARAIAISSALSR